MEDHPMTTKNLITSAQHTPGPWTVEDESILDSRGWSVASVNTNIFECGANSRLIAAAPDMLGALREAQKMLAHMTSKEYQLGGDAPVRRKIEAILARVDGA
jgi:protein required for attachment to host cells